MLRYFNVILILLLGLTAFAQKNITEKAKNYIYALEDFIGTKVSSISTSPEREDTILLENPFEI